MKRHRAFTLVELMIVVAVIGVLAALAIYGVRKYLATSKASEAKQAVGRIARSATAAFERERVGTEALGEGAQSKAASHLLCESAKSVPKTVPAGKKYQPNTADGSDFSTGDKETGWKCLRFRIDQPIYYQYLYTKDSSVAAPNSKGACVANGNGIYARFAITGQLNTKTGALRKQTNIYAESEYE